MSGFQAKSTAKIVADPEKLKQEAQARLRQRQEAAPETPADSAQEAETPPSSPAEQPDRQPPGEPPGPDKVAAAWADLAAELEGTEIRLSTIMRMNPLKFENGGHTLVVSVTTDGLLKTLEKNAPRLLRMLQKSLNCRGLSIEGRVVAVEEGPRKAYTQHEKFEAMKARNPALAELQRALGLDLDG